eukprot:72020_1
MSDYEKKVANNKIEFLSIFLTHFDDFKENKGVYVKQENNPESKSCTMTTDYKQKIPIGHKKNEPSWVFHELKLRNCLAIVFSFAGEKVIFDVITNITNQTSLLSKCILNFVMNHPVIISKFNSKQIEKINSWFDVGTHFCNKSMLHHYFYQLPALPHLKTVQEITYHNHTEKHGKGVADGHLTTVTEAVDEQGETEEGVQSSADIVRAIQKKVSESDYGKNITYCPIDFDIDGPLKDSIFMQPLKKEIPQEQELVISQLKAFKHYTWRKYEQDNDIDTEREVHNDDGVLSEKHVLTLPSLRARKMNNIGKVLIETKHKMSSTPIFRYHTVRTKNSTKPTIAKEITPPKMNTKEMKRQIDARNNLINKYIENKKAIEMDLGMENDVIDQHMNDVHLTNKNSMEIDSGEQKKRKQYKSMNKTELKKLCVEKGLKRGGNMTTLIQRLLDPTNPIHKDKRKKSKK